MCSNASWPILIIGLFLGHSTMGDLVFNLGVLLFVATVVFQLITLPVEFNASRRALEQMEAMGIVYDNSEARGAKKVLSAAALTYVAALAMALLISQVMVMAMALDKDIPLKMAMALAIAVALVIAIFLDMVLVVYVDVVLVKEMVLMKEVTVAIF